MLKTIASFLVCIQCCVACRGDSAPLETVLEAIAQAGKTGGKPLDDLALIALASRDGINLSHADLATAWRTWSRSLRPVADAREIAAIVEAQAALVANAEVVYRLRQIDRTRTPAPVVESQCRFIAKGTRLYREDRTPEVGKGGSILQVVATDGKVQRVYQRSEGGGARAAIDAFEARSFFFSLDSPFAAAMLLGSATDLDQKLPCYDLRALLAKRGIAILDRRVPVDGIDCCVVTDGAFRCFLDPAQSFAVVRLEHYILDFDGAGRLRGSRLDYLRQNMNFLECDAGVWIPRDITQTWFRDGKTQREVETTVVSVKPRPDVREETFVDIFAEGSVVMDSVKHVSYIQGANPRIADVLNATVTQQMKLKEKTLAGTRSWRLPLITVNGILLMALSAVILGRARHRTH